MTLLAVGAYDAAVRAAEALADRVSVDGADFLGFVRWLVQSVAAAMRGNTKAYEEASELALQRNVRAGIANRVWLAIMLFQNGHVERHAT